MGSIADRMKALSGKGMDVGPIAQRQSKDLSQAPAVPHKSSALGAMSVAGGAGTFGPARLVGQEQRPRAGSATSEHRPSVRSKPQLLARQPSPPPEQPTSPPHEKAASVRQTATGSSSRSIKSNEGREGSTSTPGPAMAKSPSSSPRMTSPQSITPQLKPSDSASAPNPEQAQSEFSRPLPLSPPHRSVPEDDKPSAGPPRTPDRLDDFEKAFPSLSEFGKQFEVDGPPNGAYPFEREDRPSTPPGLPKGRIGSICEEDHPEFSLPDVPTFPDLPSAPTNRPGPGLPPPPGRPDGLKAPESTGIRPPSPDMVNSLKRPASTANVSTLPSTTDFLTDSPPSEFPPEPPAPSAVLRPIESSKSRSPVPESRDRPPWISFPVAKPTHGPLPPREPPREVSKPKFPLSNSVDPDTLRTYFHNPSVDILLLDARNEEEYQRGYVGQEYEGRGAKMNVVWIDPTILMRNE